MPNLFGSILSEEVPFHADEIFSLRKNCTTDWILQWLLKEPRLTVVLKYDFISTGMNMVPTCFSRILKSLYLLMSLNSDCSFLKLVIFFYRYLCVCVCESGREGGREHNAQLLCQLQRIIQSKMSTEPKLRNPTKSGL